MNAVTPGLDRRARMSLGSSHAAIYRMVAAEIDRRGASGGRLVDVGCGTGALWTVVRDRFHAYCGLDAVRYDGFPAGLEFRQVDLDAADWPLPAGEADVVAAVETIEHLENPWAFVRSLVRLAKPGGTVIVTTPNQLSALSLLTLIVKQRFSSFQDAHFPAHRTAVLECDLRRLADACRLEAVHVAYSGHGRVPFGPWHYPAAVSALSPRRLSDNVLVSGRVPAAGGAW